MLFPPFLTIFTRALTESLFISFVLIFIYLISIYIRQNRIIYLVLSSCIVALACNQRYLGITLIPAGVLAIFLLSSKGIYQKVKAILLFSLISTLPLVFWLFRNYQLTGTLTGSRFGKARYEIETAIVDSLNTIFYWIFRKENFFRFLENNNLLRYVLILTLIICLILAIFYMLKSKKSEKVVHNLEFKKIIFYTNVIFIICYLPFLLYLSVNSNVDRLNDRLLSPVYPSVLLIFFYFLNLQVNNTKCKKNKRLRIVYFIIGLLFINTLFVLPRFVRKYIKYEGGWGYQTSKWKNADISLWLRSHKLEGKIFSNRPEFAFYNSNQFTFSSPYRVINLFSLKNVLENSYLIWFNIDKGKMKHTPKEIEKYYFVSLVQEFNKGAIYKIKEKKEKVTKVMCVGKIWNVTEGIWQGTWVKRENSNIFDAEWINLKTNKKLNDILILEKFTVQKIVLLRKSLNKKYVGSMDLQKNIIKGETQWGTRWYASVLK